MKLNSCFFRGLGYFLMLVVQNLGNIFLVPNILRLCFDTRGSNGISDSKRSVHHQWCQWWNFLGGGTYPSSIISPATSSGYNAEYACSRIETMAAIERRIYDCPYWGATIPNRRTPIQTPFYFYYTAKTGAFSYICCVITDPSLVRIR